MDSVIQATTYAKGVTCAAACICRLSTAAPSRAIVNTATTTASIPQPRGAYVAEGRQVFGAPPDCAVSTRSLQELRPCQVPCSEDKKPLVRGDVACPQHLWSDCDTSCTQRRQGNVVHTVSNSSGLFRECIAKAEQRSCQSMNCPFNAHTDCAYIIRMTMPSFDMRLWSKAWKEELQEAMATVLQVK